MIVRWEIWGGWERSRSGYWGKSYRLEVHGSGLTAGEENVSKNVKNELRIHLPAIVVVAVDVKDLLALDTQDTLKGVLAGMELRGGSSGEAPQ